MRLDELLVERGYFDNTHDAQAAVIAGEVILGEHRAGSAGMRVKPDAPIRLKAGKSRGGFVSRGGLKLREALDSFGLDVKGLSCVDLGASSGGFTDCLLQRGASRVSAVDVGVGQFDWGLRNDPRVDLHERTNIRNVSAKDIGGPFDVAVADLSFISLTAVMDDIAGFLKEGGLFVSLVKPQFEAAKKDVGDGGVVRDARIHARCIRDVLDAACMHGFEVKGLTFSPITGPAGNMEFLFWAVYHEPDPQTEPGIGDEEIECVVAAAHERLRGTA